MDEKEQMAKILIEWFKILTEQWSEFPMTKLEDLSNGEAFALSLNKLCPEVFTDIWLLKIKLDVGSNHRLKLSNVKKVVEGLYEYYTDILSINLIDFPKPDAAKISEYNDKIEIGRVLQLILCCAVNCNDKQTYITQIMELEESLQQTIMKALQDLETAWQGPSSSRNSLSVLNFDLKILQEERDSMAQKCYEADKQIKLLLEEKLIMQQELAKLQKEMSDSNTDTFKLDDDGVSMGPVQPGSTRYNDLRRHLDELKEELIQSETTKEDLKLKCGEQDKEIKNLQQKLEDYIKNNLELTQLKDEVDVLRESNDKMKICEQQLTTYKKKLEEFTEAKKQIKILEDRNAEYLQQNSQYEEDFKKYSTLKGQVELYRNEIQELHSKLDTEMSKNIKLDFEKKKLESNFTALQRNNESLLAERDNLRETVDELKCENTSGSVESGTNVSKELQDPELKQKINRLESENKALREGQGGQTALAQLLHEANKRNESLREQIKSANERILFLTQGSDNQDPDFVGEIKTNQSDVETLQIANLQTKLTQTENLLSAREQELTASEHKYRKCIERTKEIVKTLDPRLSTAVDINIFEKEPEAVEYDNKMNPNEAKLIASAFYKFGVQTQRNAIDTKLALLMGGQQSFLSRQRQSTPRKSNNATYNQK